MKEYVMKDDEFNKLVKGRTHWLIEKEAIKVHNLSGGGVMETGEHRLVLVISGISKDDTKHVVAMKINFGTHFPNKPEYDLMIEKIKAYVAKNFSKATEGGFE